VMRTAGKRADGARLRALIVVLWRAGLRISEALALAETDTEPRRGAVLIRRGIGNKRREVGMDTWAWEQLTPWQQLRTQHPVGAFFCVIHGPTAGRNWEPSSARRQLRRTATAAGVRRRCAPSTPPRPCGRDGPRGGPTRRHPAAIGTRKSRGHLDLSPTNRQLRDHRHRPRATPPSDPGHRWPAHHTVSRTPAQTARPGIQRRAQLHPWSERPGPQADARSDTTVPMHLHD
jgi:Phage integrase family